MGGWSITGNWSAAKYNLTKDVISSKVNFISGALFSWRVSEDSKNSSSHVLLVNIFTHVIRFCDLQPYSSSLMYEWALISLQKQKWFYY